MIIQLMWFDKSDGILPTPISPASTFALLTSFAFSRAVTLQAIIWFRSRESKEIICRIHEQNDSLTDTIPLMYNT